MESLGQLAKDLYRGRISRKPFIFSLAIFAIGIVLLSFLSTYLDKNHFRTHAHGDGAEFVSVLLYLLCIMVWALFCFGLVTWFMAKTAFRLNDIGLPVLCLLGAQQLLPRPGSALAAAVQSGSHGLRPAVAARRAATQAA